MHLLPDPTAVSAVDASPATNQARVACPTEFKLCVTFDMVGAGWDFVNSLHSAYKFEENWPTGMLCHLTSESSDGMRIHGIWTTPEVQSAYFRNVVVKVITRAMGDLGPAAGKHGAIDFEPNSRNIEQLIIGSLLAEFQDIGADRDGRAIQRLGSDPVALHKSFEGVPSADIVNASRELGLSACAPEGLLLLLDELDADGVAHHTQVWRSQKEADEYWNYSFLPALIDVGAVGPAREVSPKVSKLRRLSVDSAALAAAWQH